MTKGRFAAAALLTASLLSGCMSEIVNPLPLRLMFSGEPDRVAPTTSMAVMREQNEGVVVVELIVRNLGCNIGAIRLGPEDGTEITGNIHMGWVTDRKSVEYASQTLPAGEHYILALECDGNAKIAGYLQQPHLFAKAIYLPMASFTVNPGEVVYVGKLHANWIAGTGGLFEDKMVSITVEDNAAQVRAKLSETAPELAKAMVVRLADAGPRG